MTSSTRREFTEEFKREAVLLLESSGRPLMQVAKEFGIQPSMLRNWRTRGHGPAGLAAGQGGTEKVTLPTSPEQAEIRQFRKELERAQMERDIPKNDRGPTVRLWRQKQVLGSALEGSGRSLFGGE